MASRTPSGTMLTHPCPSAILSGVTCRVTSPTKNGLPSVRLCMISAASTGRVNPALPPTSSPTSCWVRPSSCTLWNSCSRTRAPRVWDNGWRRETSTSRYVPASNKRLVPVSRTRNSRDSREDRSAQWRSSSTSIMGCLSAAFFMKVAIESNRRKRDCSGSRTGGVSRSGSLPFISGTISAMSASPGPISVASCSALAR